MRIQFDSVSKRRRLIVDWRLLGGGEPKAEDYKLSFHIPIARFSSALLFRLLKIARVSRPILPSVQPGRLARSSQSIFYVDPQLRVVSMHALLLGSVLCIHSSPPPLREYARR
jgi:hypothetical protein